MEREPKEQKQQEEIRDGYLERLRRLFGIGSHQVRTVGNSREHIIISGGLPPHHWQSGIITLEKPLTKKEEKELYERNEEIRDYPL